MGRKSEFEPSPDRAKFQELGELRIECQNLQTRILLLRTNRNEFFKENKNLEAKNKRLRTELYASDNWLHRLLKSCVIMLDDGEVTKRAVEKQSRYNQQVLKES